VTPECPACQDPKLLEAFSHGWYLCNGCGHTLRFSANGEYLGTSTVAKTEDVPRPLHKEQR
jgi:uncharacterized protein (DUF983 family)